MSLTSRRWGLQILISMVLAVPAFVHAAVPNQSATPAYAEEQTILQQEKDSPAPGWDDAASGREHFDRHFIVPPGFMDSQDLILQRGGNTWRTWRNGPIAMIAGILLILVPLIIFAFYELVGPAAEVEGSGRRVLRFTYWDRWIHWTTAVTFLILAGSGIIILFGKKIMLPWMGHTVFYWVAMVSKYLHNFVGPLFIFCSIAMFVTFVRKNIFARWDWPWIKKGGGLVSHEHIPAGFFNAGEKLWFWGGVALLGLVMSVTGVVLNFPYFRTVGEHLATTRYLLQLADYLHMAGGTLYIVASMGHIYIGTWGTPGAYHAMRDGDVDEEWARAHHELWYDELHGSPAPGRVTPPDAAPYPNR
ncbi:MAG: formate dehydrogenase subunit gamma [Burkholderiaceae bacterium]